MSRYQMFKALIVLLACAAVMGVAAASLQESAGETTEGPLPPTTLGLTGAARQSLQQPDKAFPADSAGFSAYYRVSDGSSFILDKEAVDAALFESNPAPLSLLAETGSLTDLGGNYTIGSLSIQNIDGDSSTQEDDLVTTVNIYYDNEGWIVAYFPRGTTSSMAWQAKTLDAENPSLVDEDLKETILLNAINEALAGASQVSVAAADVSYYHWAYPGATNFLMFGVAAHGVSDRFVSFDIPDSFTVHEASVAQWTTQTSQEGDLCADTLLNGVAVSGLTSCEQEFLHSLVTLSSATHQMKLSVTVSDSGAAGALTMIIYTIPSE